jgi:hypothetical protein
MNKRYNFIVLGALLSACGGGGSESSTLSPPVVVSEPIVIVVIDPERNELAVTEFSLEENSPSKASTVITSSAQTSHEIVVPNGFSLASQRLFNLQINRSKEDNQAAYLSLCSDYQKHSNGSYTINYDSCLLRTSLRDIDYKAVITVTNDTKGLVAALWFMDERKPPLITDWRF